MKRILLLDNYDSFTYNLEHMLRGLGNEVITVRNDAFDGKLLDYSHVVISPGPGVPSQAGSTMELIRLSSGKIPVLGVCLGMQAIAEYLGGSIYNQPMVKHGVAEVIRIEDVPFFNDMAPRIEVGLYHSWAVSEEGDFEVIARSEGGVIMAIQHKALKMVGVQFHPESIMTVNGKQVLKNFITNYE